MTTLNTAPSHWSLEVVKGRTPGHRYSVGPGEFVLGNALNGSSGIDLADQEGTSPRRMAARQAQIVTETGGLAIVDLRSPGGTFVNRERLAAGVKRRLGDGDLIQLGPVQLRVTRSDEPQSRTAEPFLFTTQKGSTCRSWDDFLPLSAQRWNDLRDEMTSGRLTGFLASIHRLDLAPDPHRPGTADERLDAWLGILPTKTPASPELDVHPKLVLVRASSGGGSTRRKIVISNTGYRLLRVTPRLDSDGAAWLRLVGPPQVPIVIIDSSELTIEIELPESLEEFRTSAVILESNGGAARIEVKVEPAVASVPPDLALAGSTANDLGIKSSLGRVSARVRLMGLGACLAAMPLLMRLGDAIFPGAPQLPGLLGTSCLLAILLAGTAMIVTILRGELRDLPATILSGAVVGLMIAAVLIATARLIETLSGGWTAVSILIWGLVGISLAWLSLWLAPPRSGRGVKTP